MRLMDKHRAPTGTRLLTAALLLGLAGCSVAPHPLNDEEVRQRVNADQLQLYADQEPITGPLTFSDALARALKYNLDYKLKQMESALASGLHDVSSYDMLPKMLISAGYASRSNESGGTSVGIETHTVSLIPSSSVERNRSLANAAFSWNLLDFGVSYYRAKQSADQYLIAEERRRRVMQTVLQDLRTSYWRALGAQRLEKQADDLLVRVHSALGKSREAEVQGLLPPAQALAYQSALLDATTLLNARRQDLQFAKRELSALMSVPPGTRFTLAEEPEPSLPGMPTDIRKLEEIALQARPELREEDYRKRISADEARRQLLALLPSVGLDFNAQYDSNAYLYNSSWVDSGVQVSANLFKLAAIPATQKASESQAKTDNARRLALSMAVLTQVRIAVERYNLALVDYDLADQSSEVDQRMAKFARASLTSRTDSELEVIRTETRALLAQFQRYSAYATAQTAFGRIYNSLGLDVLPEDVAGNSNLKHLSQELDKSLGGAERQAFDSAVGERNTLQPLAVRLEYTADSQLASGMRDVVRQALKRNLFALAEQDQQGPTLVMQLRVGAVQDGIRRGQWSIDLLRADGSLVGHSDYQSTLRAQPDKNSLNAFSEAAAMAEVPNVREWLKSASTQVAAK
ncbi:TolC family protein [Pseudomonas sp. NA-150]|uniref:TolC family protein n=1 Tax=Pseudomonas sp. NA-150 TaxID=3367525 RepID=UPI0037CBA033